MVNENNISPEQERDFQKIEDLYHQQSLDSPSESVLKAIHTRAQKAHKPKRGIYWFLHWERSVGFAVVFLIVAGLGVLFQQTVREQEKTFTLSEISPAPETDLDFRPAPTAVPRPRQPMAPKTEVAPAEFGFKAGRSSTPSFSSTGVRGTFVGAEEEAAQPVGIMGDDKVGEGGGTADRVSIMKKEKVAAKRDTIMHKDSASYAPTLTKAPPGSGLDATFKKALQLESEKKYLLAAQAYSSIWQANRFYHQRENLLFHWAYCLKELGRTQGALKKLNQLEQINPDYPGLKEAKKSLLTGP